MSVQLLRNGLSTTPPQPMPTLRQDIPGYYLKAPIFLEDEYVEAGNFVYYQGEPNECMEPANKIAVDTYRKFLAKIDEHWKKKCDKDGMHFISRLQEFDKEPDPEEESRRAQVVGRGDPQAIFATRRGKKMGAKVGTLNANALQAAKEAKTNG